MTREQILALTGRDLDAAIAEHVMGWRKYGPQFWQVPDSKILETRLPNYSTHLNACCEAEMVALDKFFEAYMDQLGALSINGKGLMATAPADMRCRAMLLAKFGV